MLFDCLRGVDMLLGSKSSSSSKSSSLSVSQSHPRSLSPGTYSVHDFRGSHKGCLYGDVVYHHEQSQAVVRECKGGGIDVEFTLQPKTAQNPYMSVQSEYTLTLHGVQIKDELGNASYQKVSVANAAHTIPLISSPMKGDICPQEVADDKGLTVKLKRSNSSIKLEVEVEPQKIHKKDMCVIVQALKAVGLFKKTILTGKLKKQSQPKSDEVTSAELDFSS